MTVSLKIKIALLSLAAALLVTVAPAWLGYRYAHGDPAAAVDVGSGSEAAPAAPASQLHDPVGSPAAAFDDIKAAKKLGWGLMVLAALIMLCRVLGRLGGKFKVLATGRVAVVVAAVSTLAVTSYNALALGGTWMAAASAAVVALAAFWNSHATPAVTPSEPAKA
jgi:hypothetical protein